MDPDYVAEMREVNEQQLRAAALETARSLHISAGKSDVVLLLNDAAQVEKYLRHGTLPGQAGTPDRPATGQQGTATGTPVSPGGQG
jgi:hypothetical protein